MNKQEEREQRLATYHIVDPIHGIVVDTLHEGDRYKIITSEQQQFINSHVKMPKSNNFVLLDSQVLNKLILCNLSKSTYQVLFVIMTHLGYYEQSGQIIKKSGTNFGERLNGKALQSLCPNISKSTFDRAIDELINHEIIAKEKQGRDVFFIANPFIFCLGSNVPIKVVEIFQKSKWTKEKK